MSNKNSITGDTIITKPSAKFEANFDAIFRKPTDAQRYQFIRKVLLDEPLYNRLCLNSDYVHPTTEQEMDQIVDNYIKILDK